MLTILKSNITMNKFIYYLSRGLSILIVLFFGMFILEGFDSQFTWQDSFFHLLLTLIILTIALLAWRNPRIGGWLFVGIGVITALFFHPFMLTGLIISGAFLLTGLFFLIEKRI